MTALAAFSRSGYLPVVAPIPEPEPEPDPVPPVDPPPPWLTHPGTSRTLSQMLVVGDRMHLAHGSYFGGAHNIASVDLATGQPITGPLVPTEGFSTVGAVRGVVYLTWNDPTGSWNAPQGYSFSADNGDTWQERRVAPAYHFYDLREHDGDLFLAGAGPSPEGDQRGIVWRSSDNGATWEESLAVSGGDLVRVYFLAVAGGVLWCSPAKASPSVAYRWDGSGWVAEGGSQLTGISGVWQGSHAVTGGGVYYGPTGVFDGVRRVDYPQHRPCWADATHVYAINPATTHIDRAPLLTPEDTEVTWTPWLDMGEGMTGYVATTATLHDGWVYVGGTEGRIWRYEEPQGE